MTSAYYSKESKKKVKKIWWIKIFTLSLPYNKKTNNMKTINKVAFKVIQVTLTLVLVTGVIGTLTNLIN